jgi:2-polyprenyl-6-methoxyphenol hydroxylase-like FAD-dependent oxidoreductase
VTEGLNALVIGGGIGGLTTAIALRRKGATVDVIERDPEWSVYGVGIIQQANVLRAMKELDLLGDYLDAGFGYDYVEIFIPTGERVARIPSPRLIEGYPANLGISRRALHKVLGDRAVQAGASVRLGVTATSLHDDGEGVDVGFSDGSKGRYDVVVGADGLYSTTRQMILPDAPAPDFTGQAVWRYNLKRPADMTGMQVYEGRTGVGLIPLSSEIMYLYLTTPEPDNPRYPRAELARTMRRNLAGAAPAIVALSEQITDDDAVVYKPLETLLLEGDWHRGRVVLVGDSVHAATPHLGQGAGMAIEDSIVLAEELERHATPEAAFRAYRDRRFERCAYIVNASRAICLGQIGKGPTIEQGRATQDMYAVTSAPI